MNSKIIITGRHAKLNNKFSKSRSSSRSRVSKTKFEDIELGSTIGEIYRKSRNKSAISNRKKKKIIEIPHKSMISNRPKKKQYYKNSLSPQEKPSEKKIIKINTPISKTSQDTKLINKSQKSTSIKKSEKIIKPINNSSKNNTKKKSANNPNLMPKQDRNNKEIPLPRKSSSKKQSRVVKKKQTKANKPDYKKVVVKTNLDHFVITDNLVSCDILNTPFANHSHFSRFKDEVDVYLMKVISGGIDINKYHQ